MEKILLTGMSGFVGKELVNRLLSDPNISKDFEVHAIERYVTGRYSLDQNHRVIMHYANLVDYPAIRNIVKEVKPDYVIHLAAVSAVSFSYDHFVEVSESNYIGTVNLAESCYREVPNFKQFIFAGTSEEYGLSLSDKNSPLVEESDLQPNSPYAVSKVASDLYLKYMGKAYDFPYTIMRPFNTYGRKENTHFFIERTVTQMLSQDKVYLGDPNAIRDWLYIDDHVEGYIRAIGNKNAIKQVIQLCSGNSYSTKETAEIIANKSGFKGDIIWNASPQRPLDAKVLIGNPAKAKALLGWEPRYTFEEGIRKTIDYWKAKELKLQSPIQQQH